MRENHVGWGRQGPDQVGLTGSGKKFGFYSKRGKKSLEGSAQEVL